MKKLLGDDDYIKIFAPLSYRVADKIFKFVSWTILLTAIKYTAILTKSTPVLCLQMVGTAIFAWTLALQLAHVVVRDPSDWNIPTHLRTVSRAFQVVVGFTLLMIVMTPFLFIDPVMESLMNAKLPK